MRQRRTKHTRHIGMGLVALMLCLCMAWTAGADNLGVVTGGKLHLRAAPSTDAEIIATYDSGSHVQVTGVEGNWYAVETYDGQKGYMEAEFIFISNYGRVENGRSYVNLREGPSRDAAIIGRYGTGTVVTMLSEDSAGWLRVEIDGVTGYMDASFVRAVPEEEVGQVESAGGSASTGETAALAVNPYELTINGDNSVIQQVGQAESAVYADETLAYTIYYPVLGIGPADAALQAWVNQTVEGARELAEDLGEGAAIDLTVHYDSYLVANRYIGVLEAGFLGSAALAHPTDAIATVNADIQTDRVLTYRDIFDTERLAEVVAMLAEKLSALEGNPIEGIPLEESWLDNALITPQGIAIVLPRGAYMPAAWGTLSVVLPYETLMERGLLALEMEGTAPAATPAVAQPTAAPQAVGERTVDPTRPMVALTFDDGPSDHTLAILALLEANGGRGTFCMVGNRIANYVDVVAQVAQQGSEIASHTWAHKQLTTLTPNEIASQIQRSTDAITAVTGQPVTLLRPPYGSINADVRSVCKDLGLRIVTWSIDTEDWKTNSADATYAAIMNHVQNGSIVLCHDVKGSTARAMERVIPELVARGYQLVTVSELLQFTTGGGEPGVVYNRLDTSHLEAAG